MLYIPRSLRECTKCHQWLVWSDFHINKAYADGLTRQCRKCRSKTIIQNHKDNPESAKRSRKKYQGTDKQRALDKRFYDSHKEQVKIKNKKFRDKNPTYYRDYGKRNSDQRTATTHRRLARKRSLPDTFTTDDWQFAKDAFAINGIHCCAVCARPIGLWHTLAMDHWIPLISPDCPGTVPLNIVPLCHGIDGCNNTKHTKDPIEWLNSTFGPTKAKAILKRIGTYFALIESRNDHDDTQVIVGLI